MYTILDTLPEPTVVALEQIKTEVTFSNTKIRPGLNAPDRMSVYNYSKWTAWDRTQRNAVKEMFDPWLVDHALVAWFLEFPKNRGFLDVMNYWQNQPTAGKITAYALTDQDIVLDNERVTVDRGQGIHFGLKTLHEIKGKAKDQVWFCFMTLVDHPAA